MSKKRFHLGDVLSITTDRLVSPSHIGGVYGILNHMLDDNLFTHQLPRAGKLAKPYLLAQFPQLGDIEPPEHFDGKEHVLRWLAELTLIYGEWFEVEQIPEIEQDHRDPLTEMAEMLRPDQKIVTVVLGKDNE